MSKKTVAEVDKIEATTDEKSKVGAPSNFYSRISLFERIGGENTIDAIVEIMILKVLADPRIRHFFDDTDLEKLRVRHKEFFFALFGGDRKKNKFKDFFSHPFGGKKPYDMKMLGQAHAPLVAKGLSGNHFDAMMDNFFKTLVELKIPSALMKEAIKVLASTRFVILGNGNKDEEHPSPQAQVHDISPESEPAAEDEPGPDSTVPNAENKSTLVKETPEVSEEEDGNYKTVGKAIQKTQKVNPETHPSPPSGETGRAKSLFDRIGGHEVLGGVVDMMCKNAVEDSQLALFFHDVNQPRLRAKMKAFMTMAFGGPSKYNDGILGEAHSMLRANGLTDAHFNAMRGHLEHALREHKVPQRLIVEVLKIVERKRSVILAKPQTYSIEEGIASFDKALTEVVDMEASYMRVTKEKKQLIKKNHQLVNEIARLESQVKLSEEEKIRSQAENERLAGEIDLMKNEKDNQAQNRLRDENDKQRLENEKEFLVEEKERLENEKECLENEKEFLEGEKELVLRNNEQLEREKRELSGEVERMFSLVDSLPTKVIFCDEDLNILFMNSASYRAFEPIENQLPIPPEKMPCQPLEILHENIESQRSFLMDPKNLPHVLNIQLGPDYLDFKFHPLRSKSGPGKGVIVTWDVVTERFKLDQRQAEIQEELKNVLTEVQSCWDFLADMEEESTVSPEMSPGKDSQHVGLNLDPVLCDPQNLPYRTQLKMGTEILELCVSPVYDGNRNYLGPQVTWELVTRRMQAEQREKVAMENMHHVLTQVGLNSEILSATSEKLFTLSGNMSRNLESISNLAKEVIKGVTSIATQAQLVAMNTSIDAAWAGDSGHRESFGAEIIQRLATQTTQASEDINQLVKDIQFKTCEIVDSTQKEIQGISRKISEVGQVINTTMESDILNSDEITQAVNNGPYGQANPFQKAVKEQIAPPASKAELRQAEVFGRQLAGMAKRLEALVLRFQGEEPPNGNGRAH